MKHRNLVYAGGIFVLIQLIIWLVVSKEFYLIEVGNSNMSTVLESIIGACSAFLGFIIIYLTIAYEKYKKEFGAYAGSMFSKDITVWGYVGIFIFIALLALITLLCLDSPGSLLFYLFNSACIYFTISLLLIIPFGKRMLNDSSSLKYIQQLVSQIDIKDFQIAVSNKKETKSIFELADTNSHNNTTICSNILYTSISEKNGIVDVAIIKHMFDKVVELLSNKEIPKEELLNVTKVYISILKKSFGIYRTQLNENGVRVVIGALQSLGIEMAHKKVHRNHIEALMDVFEQIARSLIETESEELIDELIWALYHISKEQLDYNLPKENEIWEINYKVDPYQIIEINETAHDLHLQYDEVSGIVGHRIPRILDRTFLCKNYYIVENAMGIYSSFIKMIFQSDNIGKIQKERIGGALCYETADFIVKYAVRKLPKTFNYLHYYPRTSTIIQILKGNKYLGKSVVSSFKFLFRYLMNNELIVKYDIEEISTLCRLIITYSAEIENSTEYVSDLIELLKELKTEYLKDIAFNRSEGNILEKAKENVTLIQNQLKNYVNTVAQYASGNTELQNIVDS